MKALVVVSIEGSRVTEADQAVVEQAFAAVGPDVTVLIVGTEAAVEASRIPGRGRVLISVGGQPLGPRDPRVLQAIDSVEPDVVFVPASDHSRIHLPGIAGAVGYALVPGVRGVSATEGRLQAVRHWARGNASAVFDLPVKTIVSLTPDFRGSLDGGEHEVVELDAESPVGVPSTTVISLPELAVADRVVGIGRGVAMSGSLGQAKELQISLGAGFAASRQAIEEKTAVGTDKVGETGAAISPELYLALGLSGASQHMSGVIGARRIIAVESSGRAPIADLADATFVAPLEEFLPLFIHSITALKRGETAESLPARKES